MDSLGDVPITRWFEIVRCTCTRRDSHAVLVLVQSGVCGCLYPTCTGAAVRSPVYSAEREVGWQRGFIYTLLPVMTLHAFILL